MPAQLVAIQARDSNGDPVSGAKFYTYAAGTSTPQAVYSDNALSTSVANPVVCDSYGRAAVWMDADLTYKFALKTSDDATNLIPTIDNYSPRVDDILYLISVDTATALSAAQDAQAAAEAAQAAAETAQTNAETAETGAETAETNSASSAAAAATSETNSANSATASAASATASQGYAAAAATSETNAAASASSAETAKTAAETAQGLAETAAAATEGSATASASSAAAASTSATAADASADEALARLAATTLAAVEAIGTVLGPKFVAKSATTLAQPVSPANGDTYILPASGTLTGTDWSGFTNGYVARYMTDGGWFEDQPAEGWRAYVQDSNIDYLHDGTNWKHDPGQITINAEEYGLTTATTEAARVTALQAAIDAAKVEVSYQLVASANKADLVTASVLIPSGVWTFNASITVDMGVTLKGQGMGNTILDFSTVAAAAGTAIKWGDAASSNEYFATCIEDVAIIGDATLGALSKDGTAGSIGVSLGKVYRNCAIRRCAIWGFDSGISGEAFGYEIEGNFISNNRSYGADLRNATATVYRLNRTEYSGIRNLRVRDGASGADTIGFISELNKYQYCDQTGVEFDNVHLVSMNGDFIEANNDSDNSYHGILINGTDSNPRVAISNTAIVPTNGGTTNFGDAIRITGAITSLITFNIYIRDSGAFEFANGINFVGTCGDWRQIGGEIEVAGTEISGLSNVDHYDYIPLGTTDRVYGGRPIFERQSGNQQLTVKALGTNANSSVYITANGTGEANVLMGDESDADPGRLKYENSGDVMSIWSANNRRVNFSGNTTDTTVAVHAPADAGNSILNFEDTSGVAFSIDMDHNNGRAQFKYAGTTTIRIDAAGTVLMIGLPTGTSQVNAGAAANQLWVDTADQTIKLGT